ncbi:hypothetical protein DFO66_102214 [Brevibacterium sanguinis]|uniref:Integral membrane protein n=2 Tax=Brevibacterium TaxID=1696 RepID=A0A366ILS6_9MICO|nr:MULTISPECIES: hypothetical protein [Brevibacterium]RBP67161.1 hypothetical protein DFO66_102214 [Brevibacterium sanguinis]RBP73686.1 hypothetical protein DFO65_102214 [Brevibacterium celere]
MNLHPTPRHRSTWLWYALRIIMTLWFLQVLLQTVFAAGFVSGSTSWFSMHSLNAAVILVLPLFLAVPVAILNAVVARGARWPLAVIPLLVVLTMAQAILGYTRTVGPHIVGGVLIVALSLLTCVALWRCRHAPRTRRRRRGVPASASFGDLPSSQRRNGGAR